MPFPRPHAVCMPLFIGELTELRRLVGAQAFDEQAVGVRVDHHPAPVIRKRPEQRPERAREFLCRVLEVVIAVHVTLDLVVPLVSIVFERLDGPLDRGLCPHVDYLSVILARLVVGAFSIGCRRSSSAAARSAPCQSRHSMHALSSSAISSSFLPD